jgi:hypothetical protein
MEAINLDSLPHDLIILISTYLDLDDVISLSQVRHLLPMLAGYSFCSGKPGAQKAIDEFEVILAECSHEARDNPAFRDSPSSLVLYR